MNEKMKTLLRMFSNHRIQLLIHLLKETPNNQGCAQFERSDHLSVSKSGFVAGGCTPCLELYVEQRNFICDRSKLWNNILPVLAGAKFEAIRRMQNSFLLNAGDDNRRSVLWVAELLLLLGLDTKKR